MACSKYQYVRKFETSLQLLPDTFIMVRIDGKGFTKFCENHKFKKPNDIRCIDLMNASAKAVMVKFQDIFLSYGQSDEYSFVFTKSSELFNRREVKIISCLVSTFTAAFVMSWSKHFQIELRQPPVFDGRCVCYPNLEVLKDYFRWRQVDCHINNLYNTVFWCLVKQGKKNTEVQEILRVTNSGDKNQILFKDFGINYNNIQDVYRKGSVQCYYKQKPKEKQDLEQASQQPKQLGLSAEEVSTKQEQPLPVKEKKTKYKLQLLYVDIIKESFWENIKM